MNRRIYTRLLGGLLALLVLSGCAGSFQQPVVNLQGVEIGGLGLRGGTLVVNLQIFNPNRFALSANQLSYDLQIGGSDVPGDTTWTQFASGTYAEPFSVPAGDSASVAIPVEFSYTGLGSAANSLLRSGTFDYRATGTVDVRTPLGSREVPFRRQGTVPILGGG